MSTFGTYIKEKRINLDYSLEDLASKIKLSSQEIEQLENNQIKPTIYIVHDLVDALNLNTKEAIEKSGVKESLDTVRVSKTDYSLLWIILRAVGITSAVIFILLLSSIGNDTTEVFFAGMLIAILLSVLIGIQLILKSIKGPKE